MRKFAGSFLVFLALIAGAPAMAATILLNTGGVASGGGRIFTDGTTSVRVTGWSTNGTIDDATLGQWTEGLGVQSGSTDNSHTVDNSGRKDFLILQFNQRVKLTTAYFRTGWHSMNDTDATIGYGHTALPITTNLPIDGQLTSALGFLTQYGSGGVGQSGNSLRNINPLGNAGNVWLIGSAFANPDSFKDGFKLKNISFDRVPPPVPEPESWLMLVTGFGLVGASMRRRKQKLTPSRA